MIELTTQCPQCRHRFDVNLPQLQQRKGLLRCAQCAHIFDGYECAVNDAVTASPASSAPPSSSSRVPYLRTHFIGDTPLAGGIELPTPMPMAEETDAEINPYSDIRVYLDTPTIAPAMAATETQAQGLSGASASAESPPPYLTEQPTLPSIIKPKPYYEGQQGASWTHVFWRMLFGLLLLLLVAQLLFIYRVQIANSLPMTRPALQVMCDVVNCELPYMREIDAIEVSQSALKERLDLSTGGDYAYQLQFRLTNRLQWPQEWPTLILSFSDAAAAGLATIEITPDEYLSVDQREQPFAPQAQQSIQLPVWISGKKINGFSIEKYYP